MLNKILVWDLPTRLFHWLLATSFVGAYLTAETERYRDLHLLLGYTLLGLILFRVIWGLAGTRYARFSQFLYGPARILAYLKSLLGGQPEHYLGHNPAGALAIFLLLGLGMLTAASGVLLYFGIGGEEAFEEVHEVCANGMLAVVVIHIAGVVVSSWLHRENLVRAMVTGYKSGDAGQGIHSARTWVAGILLAVLAAFWVWAPQSPLMTSNPADAMQVESDHD